MWVKADDPGAADRLKANLENHVRAANVRGLRNDSSKYAGKVDVKFVPYKSFTRRAGNRCDLAEFEPGELSASTKEITTLSRAQAFHIEVKNTSDKPLLMYIYTVDSYRSGQLYVSASGAEEPTIAGCDVGTNQPNNAGFLFRRDITARNGKIKIVLSDQPIQPPIC